MTSRSEHLAHSAGAAAPASAETSEGIPIFDEADQHSTGPPAAMTGGAGNRPPGQIGGSLIGAAGGDGDDSDASGSSLELVLEPAGEENGDSSAGTVVAHAPAEVTAAATVLGESDEGLPPEFFGAEAVEEPAVLATLGPTAEDSTRFGRWDLAACIGAMISIGSLITAGAYMVSHGAMG